MHGKHHYGRSCDNIELNDSKDTQLDHGRVRYRYKTTFRAKEHDVSRLLSILAAKKCQQDVKGLNVRLAGSRPDWMDIFDVIANFEEYYESICIHVVVDVREPSHKSSIPRVARSTMRHHDSCTVGPKVVRSISGRCDMVFALNKSIQR